MPLETSYTSQAAGSAGSGSVDTDEGQYWPLSKLRKCYTDYLTSKRDEIDEQIDARRYYHGSQWTAEQLRVMQKRKQPPMTFNRVARKIHGIVGLIERLRQDPKAYPRTPQHEEGAELATAVIRYVLDNNRWTEKSALVALDGAVDGIGGIELILEQGDQGDLDIGFEVVDVQSHFYDPRSYKDDFSDARYHGVGKWVDEDMAKEQFPDADPEAFEAGDDDELQSSSDREMRWFSTSGQIRRVRLIDIWYKHKGGWCWCVFTGKGKVDEGKSLYKDEDGRLDTKYIMFSGDVDQDGDRYGFVRNMKSPQDGINAKQSRMQHMLHSKRLFIRQGGTIDGDVEKVRAEYAKNDGVIMTVGPVNESVKADDISFDFTGMDKMLERNLAEIENFGPNPALIGQGIENKSGRAIALLQQAGMAELGPYIGAFKGWKLRVYRAIWNAVQQHWKAERYVRVTDNTNLQDFMRVNYLGEGPDGRPTIVNAVGSLDVDVILDEGPDTVNMMADDFETLQTLAAKGLQLPPQALIELAPLAADRKKRILDIFEKAAQQPNPEVQAEQARMQAEMQSKQMDYQLENDKAVAAHQLKQMETEANAQNEHAKTSAEIQALEMKNAATIQLEREKAMIQANLELQKASIAAAAKQIEIQLQCEQAEHQMEMDRSNQEHEHKSSDKAQKDGTKQIAVVAKSFEKSIQAMSKAMTQGS